MIVIISACLLPILGMLQNSQVRSKRYELATIMQNLAESRVNTCVEQWMYEQGSVSNGMVTEYYPTLAADEVRFQVITRVDQNFPMVDGAGASTAPAGVQSLRFRHLAVKVAIDLAHRPDLGEEKPFAHTNLTLTAGSDAVTGVGTQFLRDLAAGSYLTIGGSGGSVVMVAEIIDDTNLRLAAPWGGATGAVTGSLVLEPLAAPIVLTTMMTQPMPPTDFIYACEAATKKIYVVDPRTHQNIAEYTCPHKPLHLAVHPGGGWLAIKCKDFIDLMDIRVNSGTRGAVSTIATAGGGEDFCQDESAGAAGEDNHRKDRGIVFRPDGNYLYFTMQAPQAIRVLQAPAGAITSPWVAQPDLPITNKAYDFKLFDDGFIYHVSDGSAKCRLVCTHNNLVNEFDVPFQPTAGGDADKKRGIAQSWGGRDFFGISKSYFLGFFTTYAPTTNEQRVLTNLNPSQTNTDFNDLCVSRDNRWLLLADCISGGSKNDLHAIRLPLTAAAPNSWDLNNAKQADLNNPGVISLRPSPYGAEIIADTLGDKVFFVPVATFAANPAMSVPSWSVPGGGNVSGVEARVAERLFIGCANNSIQCLDLYADVDASVGQIGGRLDDTESYLNLAAAPRHLALTAGGDELTVAYAGSSNVGTIDLFDRVVGNAGINVPGGGEGFMQGVRLNDRSLLALFSTTSCDSHFGAYPFDLAALNDAHNGANLYEADANGNISGNPKVGFTLPGTAPDAATEKAGGAPGAYRVKQVVAMNRRPGGYALLSNDVDDSVLIWFEKTKMVGWDGNAANNEYKVLSVWRTAYGAFPPRRSTRMALSPDDSTLVICSVTGNGTHQQLQVFDLTNQRFPMQPGLGFMVHEGAADGATDKDFANAPVSPTSPVWPRKLLTDYWTESSGGGNTYNPKPYPANHWFDSGFPGTSDVEYRSSRYWGYLLCPYQPTSKIAWTGVDFSRFFIDGTEYKDGGASWDVDNNQGTYHTTALAVNRGLHHLQIEYCKQNNPTNSELVWGFAKAAGIGNAVDENPGAAGGSGYELRDGGGNAYDRLTRRNTQAWRFRPQLLHAITLDGTNHLGSPTPVLPGGAGGGDDVRLVYHRDTTNQVLFVLDGVNTKLYALGLFGDANWGSKTTVSPQPLPAGSYVDMTESPDGRRLVLTKTGANEAVIIDIAYPVPFAPPDLGAAAVRAIGLPAAPTCIAARPLAAFSSRRETMRHYAGSALAAGYPNRMGNQNCTVGPGGVYILGGCSGHDNGQLSSAWRFNPVTCTMAPLPNMPAALADNVALSYDGRVYAMGGWTGAATGSVFVFDPTTGTWASEGTVAAQAVPLRTSANAPSNGTHDLGCLTPYGPMVFGGTARGAAGVLYVPHIQVATAPPRWGDSFDLMAMSATIHDGAALCHYSVHNGKYYLYRFMGGVNETTSDAVDGYKRFDLEAPAWTTPQTFPDLANTKRNGPAACSWGSEIFLLGGAKDAVARPECYAWNPDTNALRQLPNRTDAYTARSCAVAAGPYIWVIDGATSPSTSGVDNATGTIRCFKP